MHKASQELAELKKKLAEREQALGVDHEETLRHRERDRLTLESSGQA